MKIKKARKTETHNTKAEHKQPKKTFRVPELVMGLAIFLTLGVALLVKNIYFFLPAGLLLMALLVWVGLMMPKKFIGQKRYNNLRVMLTPLLLVAVLLISKVYSFLKK